MPNCQKISQHIVWKKKKCLSFSHVLILWTLTSRYCGIVPVILTLRLFHLSSLITLKHDRVTTGSLNFPGKSASRLAAVGLRSRGSEKVRDYRVLGHPRAQCETGLLFIGLASDQGSKCPAVRINCLLLICFSRNEIVAWVRGAAPLKSYLGQRRQDKGRKQTQTAHTLTCLVTSISSVCVCSYDIMDSVFHDVAAQSKPCTYTHTHFPF